ncbi:MAG: hypothetical protein LBR23_08885 [Spirochaetaceae bacterium]|jgi:hypothetical protein|nr:hypothetical protein [Spirochaetaceae bacterium]
MKNTKKIWTLAAIITAMAVVVTSMACKSAPEPKKVETVSTYAILDHKGAALGNNDLPQWLTVYLDTGLDTEVEKLSNFKGQYCFIGTNDSTNKKFAQTWAAGADGPTLIAATISTRVENVLKSTDDGSETTNASTDEATMQRVLDNVRTTTQSATFSGARKVGDWWIQIRRYDPDDHTIVRSEEYTAYVLYTIEKKSLDRQVAAKLQNTLDNDKTVSLAERAIYTGLITRIIEQGLDLEPSAVSAAPASSTTPAASNTAAPAAGTAKVALLNKRGPSYFISTVNIFDGTATRGQPRINHTASILADREAEWNLPEGPYTFVVYYNNQETEWAHATVAVTAGDSYKAEARDSWNFGFAKL